MFKIQTLFFDPKMSLLNISGFYWYNFQTVYIPKLHLNLEKLAPPPDCFFFYTRHTLQLHQVHSSEAKKTFIYPTIRSLLFFQSKYVFPTTAVSFKVGQSYFCTKDLYTPPPPKAGNVKLHFFTQRRFSAQKTPNNNNFLNAWISLKKLKQQHFPLTFYCGQAGSFSTFISFALLHLSVP